MRKIRIGKEIRIQWVLHAPAGIVLTSENLSLEMKDPKGRHIDLPIFTLEGLADSKYVVYVTLRGTVFSQLGNYTLTAWLNKNQVGQSVVDAVNAFTLVGSTQAEDDLQSCGCGCLNLATIDLQGSISFAGQPGYSPTANVVKEGDTVTITITDKDGTTTATVKDGKDGDDGISPTAEVSKSGSVVTISITDKDGTHTATVRDGQDGQNGNDGADGNDGQDGADGVSPSVTISSITGGHQVTITDAEHPQGQSFNVMDGQGVPEIFWATYGTTTATEIGTALSAGKVIMCNRTNHIYILTNYSSSEYTLTSVFSNQSYNAIRLIAPDTWQALGTTSFQSTSQRISSTSTTAASDSTYYSALRTKNMIDEVDAKIGSAVSFTYTYTDNTTVTYNLLTSNS